MPQIWNPRIEISPGSYRELKRIVLDPFRNILRFRLKKLRAIFFRSHLFRLGGIFKFFHCFSIAFNEYNCFWFVFSLFFELYCMILFYFQTYFLNLFKCLIHCQSITNMTLFKVPKFVVFRSQKPAFRLGISDFSGEIRFFMTNADFTYIYIYIYIFYEKTYKSILR